MVFSLQVTPEMKREKMYREIEKRLVTIMYAT